MLGDLEQPSPPQGQARPSQASTDTSTERRGTAQDGRSPPKPVLSPVDKPAAARPPSHVEGCTGIIQLSNGKPGPCRCAVVMAAQQERERDLEEFDDIPSFRLDNGQEDPEPGRRIPGWARGFVYAATIMPATAISIARCPKRKKKAKGEDHDDDNDKAGQKDEEDWVVVPHARSLERTGW